jgi:hypothetical protein
MENELKRIAAEAWKIVNDPKANRIERLTALQLVAATRGILLFEISEQFLSARQITELRRIKQTLVEKVLKKKAKRAKCNRRNYLRRRINALAAQEQETGK